MARAPNEKITEAHTLYKSGMKLIEIANQLSVPPGTVRRWKSTHKWDDEQSERSKKKSERSKKKKGGQPNNKNAIGNDGGAPKNNKNAEKHGFFSKYLPEETASIIQEIEQKNPIDILWENIQIAYAAIVRAQKIAFVKNNRDKTINKIGYKYGDSVTEERWEVQEAWDKQENFLKAQARAQSELRSMIKQYDEMLHKDWGSVTEEQKLRISVLKTKANMDDSVEMEDDGFLKALNSSAGEDWSDEEES